MKNKKTLTNPLPSSILAGLTNLPTNQNLLISFPALPHGQKSTVANKKYTAFGR